MNQKEPLIPESALKYFEDSSQISYNEYLRAYSLRNCLENIVNTIFIYLTEKNRTNRKKWIKKISLNQKINLSKKYFSDDKLFNKLIHIKDIGNKAHPDTEEHENLTHEEINLALEDISEICEWVIITYLKKYGFNQESWIPTMLSTLPPIYRVSILEELFNYYEKDILNKEDLLDYLNYVQHTEKTYMNALASGQISFELYQELTSKPLPKAKEFSQILLLIDKLAMAYLKNGDFKKSINFIELQFEKKFINDIFKNQMIDKLHSLEKERDNLPISQNLQQTKDYFKKILTVVKEEEYSLFITIFTAIVAQDELVNQTVNKVKSTS